MAGVKILLMEPEATEFLKNGVIGRPGHDSTRVPFMQPVAGGDVKIPAPRASDVAASLDEVKLPPRLKALFKAIGVPSCEYLFNHWTLLSLDFVRNRVRALRDAHGQDDVVDFAMCYAGMGHVVMCAYSPSTGKIFYRVEGGANGYEQDHNHKLLVAYKPKDTSTFFDEAHWFETVASQIKQNAYEPLNLPLTHLDRTN